MQAVEFSILDFIRENLRCAALDVIMPFFTHLGDKGMVWIISGFLLCFFPRDRRFRRCGIEMLAALLIGVIIGNLILKNIAMRERPCRIREIGDMLIPVPRDHSFPSGHTLSSSCAAAVLMCHNRRLGIAGICLAVMIAFSRMYLYVHFPTDILGGAIIGIVIGLGTVFLMNRYWFDRAKN